MSINTPRPYDHTSYPDYLNNHRFYVTNQSREFLKEARFIIENMMQIHSAVLGASFFGSRSVGQEKTPKKTFYGYRGKISDFDYVLFLDGNLKDDILKAKSIRGTIDSIMRAAGIPIDDGVINLVSKESIEEHIYEIIKGGSNLEINLWSQFVRTHAFHLSRYFFLAMGDEVYKTRSFIFDLLETEKNGKEIWKKLMHFLNMIERERNSALLGNTKKRVILPSYNRYPKTIEEARKYFQTR